MQGATAAIDSVVRAIEDRVAHESPADSNNKDTCAACDFRVSCERYNEWPDSIDAHLSLKAAQQSLLGFFMLRNCAPVTLRVTPGLFRFLRFWHNALILMGYYDVSRCPAPHMQLIRDLFLTGCLTNPRSFTSRQPT